MAWAKGEAAEARRWYQSSLENCRQIGHRLHMASRLSLLAQIANEEGDYAQARQYAEEGVALAAAVGTPDFGVHLLCCRVEAVLHLDGPLAAQGYLREAFAAARKANLPPHTALVLLTYARYLLARDPQEPSRVQALRILVHIAEQPALWQVFRTQAAQLAAALEAELPPAAVTAAHEAGATVQLEELAREAEGDPLFS